MFQGKYAFRFGQETNEMQHQTNFLRSYFVVSTASTTTYFGLHPTNKPSRVAGGRLLRATDSGSNTYNGTCVEV